MNLYTVKQISMRQSAFSESYLRYLIFNAANNGFDKVIVRVGRRVFIDETQFLKWIQDQNKPP